MIFTADRARRSPWWSAFILFALVIVGSGAAWFFVHAATVHASRVNYFKARGDQSGYLMDAIFIYLNQHGEEPKHLIGERNRMPIYPAFLELFYHPDLSNDQFFELGKYLNIRLAVGLLVLLGIVFWWHLPPLAAINLLGVTTFGWFIYKAGYTQSELLFYTFFFLLFVACWHLLRMTPSRRTAAAGALGGGLAALAYLTKASTLPFMGIFAAAFVAQAVLPPRRHLAGSPFLTHLGWSAAAMVIFFAIFLGLLSPYLRTNKAHFGHYFYNVNTTFYAWYDDWPSASVGVRVHHDNERWPDVPESEIPSARRYWNEHSLAVILARIGTGLADIATVSWKTYDYFWSLTLFGGVLVALLITRWNTVVSMVRERLWLAIFLVTYGIFYVIATAFYHPISGTGTARFFIAHLLPFFFVAQHIVTRTRLALTSWRLGSITLQLSQLQWLVFVILVLDVSFRTWTRMMTTYGGF